MLPIPLTRNEGAFAILGRGAMPELLCARSHAAVCQLPVGRHGNQLQPHRKPFFLRFLPRFGMFGGCAELNHKLVCCNVHAILAPVAVPIEGDFRPAVTQPEPGLLALANQEAVSDND